MHVFVFLPILMAGVLPTKTNTVVKIMDANLTWTQLAAQYTGTVNVYLTDTAGIASIAIIVGTSPDSSDLHAAQYTIGQGGTFSSVGTIDANNVLHVPIGQATGK